MTYIQSGNVVFKSEEKNTKKLEEKMSQLIKDYYAFEVPILILLKKKSEILYQITPILRTRKMPQNCM